MFEKMLILAPWIPFTVIMLIIFLLVGCATPTKLPTGLTPEIVKMCEEQGCTIILDSDVEKIKKALSSCSVDKRWQDGS